LAKDEDDRNVEKEMDLPPTYSSDDETEEEENETTVEKKL